MCFGSKVKTPKPNTNIPAPEPVPLEDPKGVEYGTSYEDGDSASKNIARVDLEDGEEKDTGDGSRTATATDKGLSTAKKFSYTTSAVRRSISKKAKK
jgi:hypothetical protein